MKKIALRIGEIAAVVAGLLVIWNVVIPFIMRVLESFKIWEYFM